MMIYFIGHLTETELYLSSVNLKYGIF
jgi:hypothetical protein